MLAGRRAVVFSGIMFAVLVLILASAMLVSAQQSDAVIQVRRARPAVTAPPATLRVDSALVTIPAQVTDPIGTPITHLTRDDFELFEDGVRQEIRYFAREDSPVSVGILLDSSGSMRDKRKSAAQAAARFFVNANPDDEFFLVEFGDRPRVVTPFTRNSSEVYERILRSHAFGRTSLYDAVQVALVEMKRAKHARKALFILSDGGDNRSRSTFGTVRTAMLESDVQLYAVGIYGAAESPEEVAGPGVLTELTQVSGGTCFPLVRVTDLPEIAARISEQLRNQYVIAYSPAVSERDGKYRKVRLTVAGGASRYRVNYRKGYYAPNN